jgi:hypothetical protein
MAHRFPNGDTSTYVEVVNGFISESPYVEEGDTVSISLLPLTALIDTSLSDKGIGQTRLLQGYHYYDGIHGSSLEYALGLTFAQQNLSNLQVTPDTSGTITAQTFSVIIETLIQVYQRGQSLMNFQESTLDIQSLDAHKIAALIMMVCLLAH